MRNVIVLDAETTGLDSKTDEILKLTILSESGDKLFDEYIRPTKNTAWPEAEKIHHITYEMVSDALTIDSYARLLQSILDKADIIVGYNHSFDMAFLENAGIHSDQKKNYDLMLEFSQLKGDWDEETNNYKWYKLKECADYYGYDWGNDTTHDSLADAKAILFCYKKMVAGEVNEKGKKAKDLHKSAFNAAVGGSRVLTVTKIASISVIGILIIIAVLFWGRAPDPKPEPTNTPEPTVSVPVIINIVTVEKVKKILSDAPPTSMKYSYNSTVEAKDDKGKTKYYALYRGYVKAWVDLSAIADDDIRIDEDNKTVSITMPNVVLQEAKVENGSLELIFVQKKYDNVSTPAEANKLCEADIKNAIKDRNLLKATKDNVATTIRALLIPLLEPEYSLVVK